MIRRSTNPFTPTFGSMPYMLAGRTELIDDVMEGLANRPGDPNRSTIFIGPRGSGKTVLLRTIADESKAMGWVSAEVTAHEGMLDEILSELRKNASHLLDPQVESVVTAVQAGPVGITREVREAAHPFRFDFEDIVEELNGKDVGVLIVVDEIDPHCRELERLASVYQLLIGEGRDVALLMAGLPGRVMALLLNEHISFIRRAFQRALATIPQHEVEEALRETIVQNGRVIDDDALVCVAQSTKGFALAIQLVGYYLWRQGRPEDRLTMADAERAIVRAREEMERSVFLPTLAELRPREHEYLQAMAQDDGPSATSDIAARMGISMTNASNLRRRLIEHGVIHEVRMGLVDFEMPMMREYLQGRA